MSRSARRDVKNTHPSLSEARLGSKSQECAVRYDLRHFASVLICRQLDMGGTFFFNISVDSSTAKHEHLEILR